MTDEKFLHRWSRLKREGSDNDSTPHGQALQTPSQQTETDDQSTASSNTEVASECFDVTSLPSLESIAADTNMGAFLQSGVPAELTRAALRRAWLADPTIRDFIGLAENQWDFTDPNAMYGFGPLHATDNVAQLVEQATGKFHTTEFEVAETETEPRFDETNPAPDRSAASDRPTEAYSQKSEPAEAAGSTPTGESNTEEQAGEVKLRTAPQASLHHRRPSGGAMPK